MQGKFQSIGQQQKVFGHEQLLKSLISQRHSSLQTKVAVPQAPPTQRSPKLSKVEQIKQESNYLRFPLMQDIADENTTFISEDSVQIMKFHGSYQQDHREKRAFGSGKFYQFMMRTRQPGGFVSNQLYLVMDELADKNPEVTKARKEGKNGTTFANSPEPIYGQQFLPRKFKIAVTVPGDNSLDLFTNDLGLVVMCNDAGDLEGFNVFVGGGMGRTHRNSETKPLLSKLLGFVPKEDVFTAVMAIVAVQRDYGRRDDRKMSRLKYLVEGWGIDRFRSVVEQYFGKKVGEARPLPPWEFKDYLGWGEQGDGKWFYGVYVQNGRIRGDTKKALRNVIDKYNISVIITPNQKLILTDIEPAWKNDVEDILFNQGVKQIEQLSNIDRFSMACPAMPLCGLAITEAERGIPDFNIRIQTMLNKLGLQDEKITTRMTGCPNGCARPYVAEIGFVGDGPASYQVWMGASPNQTRLSQTVFEKMKVSDLETTLEPVFQYFKDQKSSGEAFGDFVNRVGVEAIQKCGVKEPVAVAA